MNDLGVYEDKVPDIRNDIVDAKASAMAIVFKEKFRISSLDQARAQKLRIAVKSGGTVELLQAR